MLNAIAAELHISADLLTAEAKQAREDGDETEVVTAIRRDRDLTNAQRAALEEMYTTFREATIERRRRG